MIQKSVLSKRIRIDTEKRQYRTSKVNTLFSVKHSFSSEKRYKKSPPINSEEESFLVAGIGEISNLILLRILAKVIAFIDER